MYNNLANNRTRHDQILQPQITISYNVITLNIDPTSANQISSKSFQKNAYNKISNQPQIKLYWKCVIKMGDYQNCKERN